MMDFTNYINDFEEVLRNEPEVSPAVAAIRTLLDFIKKDQSGTVHELTANCQKLVSILTENDFSVTSVKSACEQFLRAITLTSLDHPDFDELKSVLAQRGALFLDKTNSARAKIAQSALRFIHDGDSILIHSHSRVVYRTLFEAYRAKIKFQVYVTESAPDYSGRKMHDKLTAAGINATLILDSAACSMMEKVDSVMLGAEGVVETGGIINKIGTFGIALAAHHMNKTVYVLAETFKFLYLHPTPPVNQRTLSDRFRYLPSKIRTADLKKEHPLVDFTPPAYVDALVTDSGILTTAAVGPLLSQLYV